MGGLADALDEAVRRSGVPVGRDKVPEVVVLPRAPLDLVRRLATGADAVGAPSGASAPPPRALGAAQLLTPDLRAALRMLAPALLAGGVAVQARLPYDIDIR